MEFWPEFLASSWGREFVAGGLGGMAGVVAGYPFDTLRIRIQQPAGRAVDGCRPSATALFRSILRSEGPAALYRGMAAPLASVAFQHMQGFIWRNETYSYFTNLDWPKAGSTAGGTDSCLHWFEFIPHNAMVFQVYAVLSRACDLDKKNEPPSYKSVALGGFGTGALQSFLLSPVELVKIRLQLQTLNHHHHSCGKSEGPLTIAKRILQTEGLRGIYRGFAITILRDAPAHAVYFWTYEYAREHLHPGCRKRADESLGTMLIAGGLAGVASWVCCYPLDVVKSRLQAQSPPRGSRPPPRYNGIIDCFQKSVREEGYSVLWRGLGTAITRAFVVNGAIFSAYELALRFLVNGGQRISLEKS
ncbi:Mitochondrial arginine transporter BAC2 [Dendrobium catenatum]|uniref:Mitochondrial arginine transporter BAC2 n=1 Tax=Dendrobium catenatum TaxID=906689 RepID=A0A2I0XEM0_9ASPA|nr:Mitochondrial arginine transporter BAC2 [Dendrobium catenatum]